MGVITQARLPLMKWNKIMQTKPEQIFHSLPHDVIGSKFNTVHTTKSHHTFNNFTDRLFQSFNRCGQNNVVLKINTWPHKKVHVKNEVNLNQLCTAYYKYLHKFKIIHLHYQYNALVQLQIGGISVVSDFLAAGAHAVKIKKIIPVQIWSNTLVQVNKSLRLQIRNTTVHILVDNNPADIQYEVLAQPYGSQTTGDHC